MGTLEGVRDRCYEMSQEGEEVRTVKQQKWVMGMLSSINASKEDLCLPCEGCPHPISKEKREEMV